MLPVLLDLKIIKIYTLGAFLVLAFFWGSFWLWKNIKLTSYKEEDIFDGLFISLFGSLFFSRLFFVALNFDDFGLNILKFILINGYPGLSLIGALLGGILTFFIYSYVKKIDFLAAADYFSSGLLFALAIGKMGSFFSGTDYGTQTSFFLRVSYTGHEGLRHITPIYESALFIFGFFVAQKILYNIRREQSEKGTAFFYFVMFFFFTEFVLDILKGNHLYFAGLSFNMLVSVILFVVSGLYLTIKNRNYLIKTFINAINNIGKYGKKGVETIKNTKSRIAEKTYSQRKKAS